MDILKKAKELANDALCKTSEVVNDVSEKIKIRKECSIIKEEIADYTDAIIISLLDISENELMKYPAAISKNVENIKEANEKLKELSEKENNNDFKKSSDDEELWYCTQCGKNISKEDKFCKHCGKPQK